MPQKAKFCKEEIISAAVDMIENQGIAYLTARTLGQKLGSSSRPIFTTFKNMEEVLEGVNAFAQQVYHNYVMNGLQEKIAFKGVGMAYIRFASEHPQLFQLLFMKQQPDFSNTQNILGLIENDYQNILDSITLNYHLSEEKAKKLYLHMWIYTHGIAVLMVNKMCSFNEIEISSMLTSIFKCLIGGTND